VLMEVRQANMSEETNRILQGRVGLEYNADEHEGLLPMKICPTRNQVADINNKHYEELEGVEYIFDVNISNKLRAYVETGDPIEADILERCMEMTPNETEYEIRTLKTNIPSDEIIRLKRGAVVMCLVNLDLESGIANGSIGKITEFVSTPLGGEMIPVVQFANGISRPLGRYMWQSREFPVIGASQLPLSLAYANSIHKMQGATLDVCEMNLGGSIFAEHQTYVALSRVRSLDGVYLTAFHPQRIKVNPKVVAFYAQFLRDRSLELPIEEIPVPFVAQNIGIGECPICLERTQDPYITSCKHVFCKDCIMRLFQCSLSYSAYCPMCREGISRDSVRATMSSSRAYPNRGRMKDNVFQIKKMP
jgi:Zinc finger, C3HC4 type (RING finger)/PIF1-like helicase